MRKSRPQTGRSFRMYGKWYDYRPKNTISRKNSENWSLVLTQSIKDYDIVILGKEKTI